MNLAIHAARRQRIAMLPKKTNRAARPDFVTQ
jgi:hypothetical protein